MGSIKNASRKVDKLARNSVKAIKKVPLIEEFKIFISRGNVLELAVGVIIGGAFQKLVTSLTDNIISPILGCFTEADFTAYSLKIGNLNLKYGAFLTDIINFIIMAFIVFLIVKFMNKLFIKTVVKDEAQESEVVKSDEVLLLEEIRDLLKENK